MPQNGPSVHQKMNSELEAKSGGPDPLPGHPVSQGPGNGPLPQPGREPPLPSLPLTPPPSLQHADSPSHPPSTWGSWGIGAPSHPQPPGEEAACQAATACQILSLPNCEKAAFKETLFWPPATPQTAWYNFIIKEREKEGGDYRRDREEGREERKLLSPSQLVEYSQRGSGPAFQLAS